MSESDDIIDLTLDEDENNDDDDHNNNNNNSGNNNNENNGKRGKKKKSKRSRSAKHKRKPRAGKTKRDSSIAASIPNGAYLPIGVDVTDDVVHIDSDSDNEINVAQADLEAHLQWQQQQQQSLQQQQGKFAHRKVLQAQRKRKRAAEKLQAEEKRQREAAEREKHRAAEAAERQRVEKLRQKQVQEARRKAEAQALRQNPPTDVNFIIIDSDPEDDNGFATTPRRSETLQGNNPRPQPPKGKRSNDGNNAAKRLFLKNPTKLKAATNGSVQDTDTVMNMRPATSQTPATPVSVAAATTTEQPSRRKRTPQPYEKAGARRVEFLRPPKKYQSQRDFNFFKTREDAAAEQDRLLRETAERMRQRHQQQPLPSQPSAAAQEISNVYGVSFSQVVTNIHERFPLHWMWKNPFSCLGLPPHAPLAAARAQYRTLVRCYHPDKSRSDTSNKFHAVVRAFTKIKQLHENASS